MNDRLKRTMGRATRKPHIFVNAITLGDALDASGIRFRYNLRADKPEVVMPGETDWRPFNNDRIKAVTQEIVRASCYDAKHEGEQKGLDYGTRWGKAQAYLSYHRETDPFLEYLEGLEWDGAARLDNWMRDAGFVFTEGYDADVLAWGQRYILMGAVARTYAPGCKLDVIPVIASNGGGLGKSTVLSGLFSKENMEYFTDGFNFGRNKKDMLEATLGRVMVEVAEMAGLLESAGGKTVAGDAVKAYISRTNDNDVRLAYRRDAEDRKRRYIFVATSDKLDALPNEHNLRRWVVLPLAAGDPELMNAYMPQHRDQLWAEAVVRIKSGEEARLPPALEERQSELNEQHREVDDNESEIERWANIGSGGEPFTLFELAKGAGILDENDAAGKLSREMALRLGKHLRRIGYQSKSVRINGEVCKRWRKNP